MLQGACGSGTVVFTVFQDACGSGISVCTVFQRACGSGISVFPLFSEPLARKLQSPSEASRNLVVQFLRTFCRCLNLSCFLTQWFRPGMVFSEFQGACGVGIISEFTAEIMPLITLYGKCSCT